MASVKIPSPEGLNEEPTPTTVIIPMIISAFHLSPSVSDHKPGDQNPYLLAPITQPNYTSMRLDPANITHDLLDHIDLSRTTPATANNRVYDLGTGELRRNRIGIVLHWSLPRVFRWGTSATESAKERASKGFLATPPENMNDPVFRAPPNRWLVVRHVDLESIFPQTESTKSFPEFDAWIVESDRIRHISKLGPEVDLETDVVPFINTAALTPDSNGKLGANPIDIHAETFLGYRARAEEWREETENVDRVDLGVLTSGNPFFADYQPHCSNVFSLTDTFDYTPEGVKEKSYLEKVRASYHVVGWHSDPGKDLFANFDRSKATLSSLFGTFGLQTAVPPLEDAVAWQKMLAGTLPAGTALRSLSVGRMYNVQWDVGSVPKNPNPIAEKFTEVSPIAVSTIPACGLKIFQDGFPMRSKPKPIGDEEPKDFWLEITEQAILHAGSTTRNAGMTDMYEAKDSVEDNRMWNHEEGGSRWKVSALENSIGGAQPLPGKVGGTGWKNFAALANAHHNIIRGRAAGDKHAAKNSSPLEILEDVNVLQRQLDMLARRKKHSQSVLFAEWWKRIATGKDGKETAKPLIATINSLDKQLASLQTEIHAKINELEMDYNVPCERASTSRFHIPKEPSLLVAGIPNPRPWDYSQPLPVRLHSQVVDSAVPDNPVPWSGFKAFADSLDSRKFFSGGFHPDVGRSVLGEFQALRNVGAKVPSVKSPPSGTFPHYYSNPNPQFPPPGDGGFQIVTQSLNSQNNIYVGVGLRAGDQEARPAAVFLGLPDRAYNIYPLHKYYLVAGGEYIPGQVIDVDKVGNKSEAIDLTTGTWLARHEPGGAWTVGPIGG